MIAIIYYQEPTIIGIISILLSLLSVATKALMFSKSIVLSVFIFNWLSLVIDFFGIFCMLSWVFYNPDNNGIVTEWGYIWIYQAIGFWALCCLYSLLAIGPDIVTVQWDDTKNVASIGYRICDMVVKIMGDTILYIGGCLLALFAITIGLFSPFALVCLR